MAGLIGTGLEYKNRALSGFVRQSALQEQIDAANRQLEAEGKAQKSKMTGEMVGLGAAAGAMAGPAIMGAGTILGVGTGAGTGAMIGLGAGPVGMLVGAGLGFLFSQLF